MRLSVSRTPCSPFTLLLPWVISPISWFLTFPSLPSADSHIRTSCADLSGASALISNIPQLASCPPFLAKGLPRAQLGTQSIHGTPSPSHTPPCVQQSLSPEDCALPGSLPKTHPALLSHVICHLSFSAGVLTGLPLDLFAFWSLALAGEPWSLGEKGERFPSLCPYPEPGVHSVLRAVAGTQAQVQDLLMVNQVRYLMKQNIYSVELLHH